MDDPLCFHGNISCSILIEAPIKIMFCIIWFSKQKLSSSKWQFHWRILWGIFPVKMAKKWCYPFNWIILHCNFFITLLDNKEMTSTLSVAYYYTVIFLLYVIFRLKIVERHETLSRLFQEIFNTCAAKCTCKYC